MEFRKEEIEQSIAERFEKIAREFRERPAIKSKNYSLTYDELNRSANRVAQAISGSAARSRNPSCC